MVASKGWTQLESLIAFRAYTRASEDPKRGSERKKCSILKVLYYTRRWSSHRLKTDLQFTLSDLQKLLFNDNVRKSVNAWSMKELLNRWNRETQLVHPRTKRLKELLFLRTMAKEPSAKCILYWLPVWTTLYLSFHFIFPSNFCRQKWAVHSLMVVIISI